MIQLPSLFKVSTKTLLIIILFFAVGFSVYASSLSNEFVTWDDGGLITDNPNVATLSWTTVKNVFTSYDPELYIPLTFVTYQIDDLIGGGDPRIFHATNLIFHIINALLVAWILTFLLSSEWLAIGLGLVFLLHPLNTEAVAWASARKDVLSSAFFFASLVSYLTYRSGGASRSYFWSLLFFTLGLFSKVMVVTLPIILVLLDVLEQRTMSKKTLIEKIPFFALSGLFVIIALFGKTSVLAQSTMIEKFLMAFKSTIFYIQKFLWPSGLSFAYPYTKSITLASADFWIPVAGFMLFSTLLWLYRKRNTLFVFGIALFFVTLIPTFSNFSKGNDLYFASDRYVYIPMLGLLVALGTLLESYLLKQRRAGQEKAIRNTISGVAIAVLVSLSIASHVQASVWSTSVSLYSHALEFYPNSRAAHHNLGMEYLKRNKPEAAIAEFDAAEAIKDDPRTHLSRGAAYVALSRFNEAESEYRKAIDMDPDEPDAYYGLGNIARKKGDLKIATRFYIQALAVRPDYTNALNNLGAVYIELGDWEEAIEVLKKSVAIRPEFPESYYNLAGAEERAKLLQDAEDHYKTATQLNPSDADAFGALATLLYNQKRVDEAASNLKKCLGINQQNEIGLRLLSRMQKDGYVR